MRSSGRSGIGEVPYSAADFTRAAYTAASVRLRRPSLARMFRVVLHGLAADEEPVGDLGVRQPVADQVEDLGLSLGQQRSSWTGARGLAPSERRSAAAASASRAARSWSKASNAARASATRDLWTVRGKRPGERQPAPSELHRGLCPREPRERVAEASLWVAGPSREADPPGRAQPPHDVVGRVHGRAHRGPSAASSAASARQRRVHVDEEVSSGADAVLASSSCGGRVEHVASEAVSPRARWIAATGRAASAFAAGSRPSSSCAASSMRPGSPEGRQAAPVHPDEGPSAGRAPRAVRPR